MLIADSPLPRRLESAPPVRPTPLFLLTSHLADPDNLPPLCVSCSGDGATSPPVRPTGCFGVPTQAD